VRAYLGDGKEGKVGRGAGKGRCWWGEEEESAFIGGTIGPEGGFPEEFGKRFFPERRKKKTTTFGKKRGVEAAKAGQGGVISERIWPFEGGERRAKSLKGNKIRTWQIVGGERKI